ncbi:hypothetical protein CDD83_6137 [Cordyceps sp. RAO-2017]|nr:hypothetical protein CDD83_6137 [Cordyceps sp. RAO-2017]
MHILITNDDGPPSPDSSPYVHCLVRHLQQGGHVVSVCLPHTQRSWIGKAHMIGQTLKPLYYRPSAQVHGDGSEGTTHHRPSAAAAAATAEEWVLIDGTPASCVQIGLHHFFQDRGPVDLVVSGPNYGRNTSSVFALSSGTLGAALEAAVCRMRSIALSFAFFSRNHDPVIIEAACRHSVRIIEALYRQWPTDGSVDLYTVNVPLVEDVERHKTLWTDMLQNYWSHGSCFQEVEADDADDAAAEELLIREGPGGEVDGNSVGDVPPQKCTAGHVHKHFKWAPRLADVYQSVAESDPGNDGRTVREGNSSITPLKANFAQADGAFSRKEFDFELSSGEATEVKVAPAVMTVRGGPPRHVDRRAIRAVVAYGDDYVQPLILSALKSLVPEGALDVVATELPAAPGDDCFSLAAAVAADAAGGPEAPVLQMTAYEAIDFVFAAAHPRSCLVNSYMIRKALIRKHYLSATADQWAAKRPGSALRRHVPRSEAFELDYAEFLDEALVEAFDLRASLERNAGAAGAEARQWWILKPGMSDRGQGIRLFSTLDELQAIFDGWDAERPDSDDDDEAEAEQETQARDYITTSHLRHFVAQPYIHPPLLLGPGGRKFHVRAYVLCVGSLAVYVYRPMLALFAARPYRPPWAHAPSDADTFLTNTCLHRADDDDDDDAVQRFWDLPLARATLDDVFAQVCAVAAEAVEAAARAMPVHFQPLPNAFDVLGLDFLLDAHGTAYLLEANAFPDFAQTGPGPDAAALVGGFWRGVVRRAVLPFFFGADDDDDDDDDDMLLVRRIDLGRR